MRGRQQLPPNRDVHLATDQHRLLPYGAWIRLFRDNAMVVEDLVEPPAPADAIPGYLDERRRAWAQRWPFECIWKARKQ